MALKSNHTPWTDVIDLITYEETADAAGYVTKVASSRTVFCTFVKGVSRAEFYEATRSGIQLNATVELWEDDYQDEEFMEFNNVEYKVTRVYATGNGTVEISLSEVIH